MKNENINMDDFEYDDPDVPIRNMIAERVDKYGEHLISCTIAWRENGGYSRENSWIELILQFETDIIDESQMNMPGKPLTITDSVVVGRAEFTSIVQKIGTKLYFEHRKEFPFLTRILRSDLASWPLSRSGYKSKEKASPQ